MLFSFFTNPVKLIFSVLCSMRKSYLIIILALSVVASHCKDKEKEAGKSENHVDAARNFVRAALDGKFSEARSFMLQDSINLNLLEVAERNYQKAEQLVKDGYRASTIRFHQPIITLNDTTSIIVYSNSFKNDPDTLKVLKLNSNWLVDLKYLYQHDADTIVTNNPVTDSIQ